jgi:hypothetical protein
MRAQPTLGTDVIRNRLDNQPTPSSPWYLMSSDYPATQASLEQFLVYPFDADQTYQVTKIQATCTHAHTQTNLSCKARSRQYPNWKCYPLYRLKSVVVVVVVSTRTRGIGVAH